MYEEMKARYEKEGAMAVLERLKALRAHPGDEASFWQEFLALVALLCRSPAALLFVGDGAGWSAAEVRCADSMDLARAVELSPGLPALFERASDNGFAYERLEAQVRGMTAPFLVVLALGQYGAHRQALCLVADRSNPHLFSEVLVRAGLVADVPRSYHASRGEGAAALVPRGADVPMAADAAGMPGLAGIAHQVMAQPKFLMACSTLVNEAARQFSCSRIQIGWRQRGLMRLVAVSHLEEFRADSPAAQRAESLFEEVADQETVIAVPPLTPHFVVDRAHRDYLAGSGVSQVVSLPMFHDEAVAGVLSCEAGGQGISPEDVAALALLVEIVVPWLNALRESEAWLGARVLRRVKRAGAGMVKGERLGMRIALLTVSLMIALTLVVPWDYRIEGVATLQTDQVRFVSAPFDGVVRDVFAKEGDQVRAGARLASLDTREFLLKRTQEEADIVRQVREADKSRAQNALADMRIAQSKVDEMRAELSRTSYNLERATMTAPVDGIVVEGDTKKLVGAPVAKGDVLLKIARIEGMYALIRVRERDVDEITAGMTGRMVLVSQPETLFPFRVEKVIPLAEVDQQEGNVFVVKALFSDQPGSWWRPGMSGVARIDAGRRPIAWLLTHRVVDFIRMHIWW